MQLTFDFFAPSAPPPVRRKPLTAKQQRAAEATAEKVRIEARWAAQRERGRLEARAFWKVGMVVSMPLWATVLDSPQKYTQCLPGVVETIDGDKANVRLYVAPEYGCWLDKYPLHMKLAIDVPLVELGRYALNEHLVRIAAQDRLAAGDAELAARIRAHTVGGFVGPKP
jgi:hypothetical protein